MGIDTKSAQYQADRQAFNNFHVRNGNGNFPAMRTAELQALAQKGNTYARHQLQLQGKAQMSVTEGEGKTAQQTGEAWGKAGDTLEAVSDSVSLGAQRNLRDAYVQGGRGDYVDAGKSMLKAGGRVAGGAVKTWAIDKAAGAVIGKGGELLTRSSKSAVKTLGEFASKNADDIFSPVGNGHSLLEPGMHAPAAGIDITW